MELLGTVSLEQAGQVSGGRAGLQTRGQFFFGGGGRGGCRGLGFRAFRGFRALGV